MWLLLFFTVILIFFYCVTRHTATLCSNTNATVVGARTCSLAANRFDLIEATTIPRPPIATPTVVEGDLFFGQGGDQLNGGRRGTVDCQPVLMTVSFGTIVVHRRLGTDQCDGGTIDGIHSTFLALPHVHVLAAALAGRARRVHSVTALFHHHRLQRKGRFANDTAATVRLTQRQVLQMHRTLQVSTNLNYELKVFRVVVNV